VVQLSESFHLLASNSTSPPGVKEGGDLSRAVARISGDYLLRALAILSETANGDLFDGLLALAIVQVNVGHLVTQSGSSFSDSDDPPPDDMRRPATAMAVAASLGAPYETIRRRIRKLVAQGVCEQVPGGVIVPQRQVQSATNLAALEANLTNLQRMYRSLRGAGLRLD
jgi:hypothetical protein